MSENSKPTPPNAEQKNDERRFNGRLRAILERMSTLTADPAWPDDPLEPVLGKLVDERARRWDKMGPGAPP